MNAETLKVLLASPIAFHRIFAVVGGDALTGLFLAQCWYWTQKTEDPDGWFYKTRDDWHKETLMTRRQQESARENLRDLGVMEESQQRGRDRDISYRLNVERLVELIQAACETKAAGEASVCVPKQRAKTSRSNGQKRTDAMVQNVPLEKSETYQCNGTDTPLVIGTENTAEITTDILPPNPQRGKGISARGKPEMASVQPPVSPIAFEGEAEPETAERQLNPAQIKAAKVQALITAYREVKYPNLPSKPTHTEVSQFTGAVSNGVKDKFTPDTVRAATAYLLEEFTHPDMVTPRSVINHIPRLLDSGRINREGRILCPPTPRSQNGGVARPAGGAPTIPQKSRRPTEQEAQDELDASYHELMTEGLTL